MSGDGYVHGNCAFSIDMLGATIAIQQELIDTAIALLLDPDDGYGLSPAGVTRLINLLRGEHDDFGTQGQSL